MGNGSFSGLGFRLISHVRQRDMFVPDRKRKADIMPNINFFLINNSLRNNLLMLISDCQPLAIMMPVKNQKAPALSSTPAPLALNENLISSQIEP